MGLFWDAYDREEGGGRQKDPPSPKPVTHPTMKKLGSYTLLEEDPKNYTNHVTHLLSSASHQHFFTGNQQGSLCQEIQIYIEF